MTEGSLTTLFGYNGDGVRLGKTVGAATTDYVVDLATTLPVVISDTDAVYLYGLDILAEQLAGADRYYYVRDGLGSVRPVLDSAGQIEATYAYDPFGVPLAGDGAPNPWQFTGEAWDAEVELLYLRARYYQPEMGRFVTKDPWRGDRQSPATLNRYLYVNDNPFNYSDPSGLNGGGPEGYCPEAKKYFHPLEIRWPTAPEEEIPPFEEWVKDWPDPWVDEPVGWEFGDFDPIAFKRELFRKAEELYRKEYPLHFIDALIRRNNPLGVHEINLCEGGGLYERTRANWNKAQWMYFLDELGMDKAHETNYEPYWLTLLMMLHHRELEDAQRRAYKVWYVPWAEQFGTEYEELFHFYNPGVGETG